jgi:hypothetical protein
MVRVLGIDTDPQNDADPTGSGSVTLCGKRSVLWIWICMDPHHFGNQDPLPDPDQIKIRLRIKVLSRIRNRIRIRINLQMTSQNVWSLSLF